MDHESIPLDLKGLRSRYFRVLRENPYLISSSKLENGNVEFLLLIKLSLHHKQDDSERKRPLLRTVPTNSKVFLPRFMIIVSTLGIQKENWG